MKETEKAYKEIFKVLDKYEGLHNIDINTIKEKSQYHLFGLKLKDEYGFNIDPTKINSLGWTKLGEYISISKYDGVNRRVSFPDDGRQPDNEYLLNISFPTGAYIFGDHYPTEFFERFFQELKTYEPKFIDSANKSLYFSLDKAGKIFNEFDGLYKKYQVLNTEDFRKRKIIKMEQALEAEKLKLINHGNN